MSSLMTEKRSTLNKCWYLNRK